MAEGRMTSVSESHPCTSVPSGAPAFRLYPDPCRESLRIEWTGGQAERNGSAKVRVLDLQGRECRSVPGSTQEIDLGAMPAGTYVVEVVSENGLVGRERVVKR